MDPNAPIPACPGWSLHDLIAHLRGLAEDWQLHRHDDYAGDSWTASQVERHRHSPIHDLLVALPDAALGVTGLEHDRMLGEAARWAFGDVLIHEADIYEASGTGQPPIDDVFTHLSAGLKRWSPQLAAADIALVVDTAERCWTVGSETADAHGLHVTGLAFDIWRAIYGRRTWTQFCELDWSRQPTRLRRIGLPHPFRFRDAR
jgi:hypothetical protein